MRVTVECTEPWKPRETDDIDGKNAIPVKMKDKMSSNKQMGLPWNCLED